MISSSFLNADRIAIILLKEDKTVFHAWLWLSYKPILFYLYQSGRSPKVVALFSATNFSSYIIEFHQLQDAIQIQWNYAWIHYNIAKRSHLMI